ncbi:MAG: phage tail tape measure protein [Gemmatimonadota bacterium]
MAEVLDIVVRQRGARKVARDIAQIGISATSTRDAIRNLQVTLDRTKGGLAGVTAATQRGTAAFKGFAAGGLQAKRSLTAIGTGFAIVGGAIAAGLIIPLKNAITTAADFQTAMNLTGVLANVDRASDAFKELEERAKQLGVTTQFTAVEAAEGMQFLAKAGLDANEVLGAIGPTTNLAAAASLGLARSADIATNILRGFRQDVDELPAAIDVLASAFTSSNTDIEELARAFEKAGPVAVDLGQSFTGTAATISALADAGIKASAAGTSLRRIFINLQKDSTKTDSVLRKLGISITQVGPDGVEAMRPLDDIFKDIAASSATTGDKINLFGARALAAAGIISEASGGLEKFADSIGDNVGRAAEVGSARLKGLNGAVVLFTSALSGLGQSLAESGLNAFLESVVRAATSFVRKLNEIPKPIKTVIAFSGALAAVLALVTLKVGLLAIALSILGGKEGFLNMVAGTKSAIASLGRLTIAFATNPIGIFIIALGALTAVLFAARNEIITFGDKTFALRDLVGATFDAIGAALKVSAEFFAKFFKDVGNFFKQFGLDLSTVGNFVKAFVNAGVGAFLVFGKTIVFIFTAVGRTIGTFVASAVELVGNLPDLLIRKLQGENIGDAFAKPFTDAFATLADETKTFVKEVAATLKFDFVGAAGDAVLSLVDKLGLAEAAQKRFLDRQKRLNAETEKSGRKLTGDPTGTVVGPGEFSPQQILDSATALGKLQASLDKTTAAEKRFAEITQVVNRALATGIIGSQAAADAIKASLLADLLDDVAGEADPAAKAMREFNEQTRLLSKLAGEAGADLDKIADAQRRVTIATEDLLLKIPEFTSGLDTISLLTLSVRKGFEGFAESIGSEFELIKGVVQGTFEKSLGFVEEFVTKGTASFGDFARSVIADILKIIVKLIALQAVRAFTKTQAEGGGVGDFFGNLFGDRLPTQQRQTSPELASRLGGGPTISLADDLRSGNPIPVSLPLGEAGIGGIKNPIVSALDKNRAASTDQLSGLKTSIGRFLAGGGFGGQQAGVSDAIGSLGSTIGQGQALVAESAKQGTGQINTTNKDGFNALGGVFVSSLQGLGNALTAESGSANQKQAIGALLGGIIGGAAGAFFGAGNPAAIQAGFAIGSAGGGAIGGALQEGGTLGRGAVGRPFLVGEAGPELFVPPTTGRVIPNDMLGGTPPEIRVNVINVDDAKSVPEAMSTREGEQTIMNIIQRNRGTLREIIS